MGTLDRGPCRSSSAALWWRIHNQLRAGGGLLMVGDSKAKVIPLHGNSGRAAAQRRAGQRTQASRQHPSLLSDPGTQASAGQIAAVVREIDHHRRAAGARSEAEQPNNELAQKVSSIADFLRHRLTGDYSVDEFGFDPHFNEAIVRPLLRFFFKSWFRVEVSGIEHLPDTGAALVVANHAGVLPFDGLMASVAVHDEHPAHRELRLLAADMVFDLPMVGSEEIYPMLADVRLLARLFGLPYFPITPLFPLAGPAGLVPLPSKWHIAFGEPISTAHYEGADAEDPMVTFELTDQVRETIQQTLYQLLAGRRNMFFG